MSDAGDHTCPSCGRRPGVLQAWRLLVHHAREHRPPERLVCASCRQSSRLIGLEALRRECMVSWLGVAFSLLLAAPALLLSGNVWIHSAVLLYLSLVWLWCGLSVRRQLRLVSCAPSIGSPPAPPSGAPYGLDD